MVDVLYSVQVQLASQGALEGGLGGLGAKAAALDGAFDKMGSSISGMGAKVSGVLEGIVDKVETVAVGLAKWGSVALMGAATYGVVKLNQELEQTRISLGAIFQVQGFASNFEDAFGLAGKQLSLMKQDVKTLPGDLGQLSDIMKMIATSAAQGGAGPDAIRKLAGRTMLVGTILGVQQETAAREMAALLAGRAGSHNILGGRLGLIGPEAERFNKEGAGKRLTEMTALLDKYKGAEERFSHSFVANWTTLKDNVKYGFLAPATAPLFDAVVHSIVRLNDYFDQHKDKIWAITQIVGNKLSSAWQEIESIFTRIAPIVGRIAGHIMGMSGAGIGEKIKQVAEIGLAAKFAGPAIGLGSSLIGKAVTAAGSGAAEIGAAGGMLGAMMVPVSIMAVGAAAVATMAAFGEGHALMDKTNPLHNDAVLAAKNLAQGMKELGEATKPAIGWFDKLGISITDFTGTLLRGGVEFFQGWHAVAKPYFAPQMETTPSLPADKGFGPLAALGLIGLGEGGNQEFWDKAGAAVAKGAAKVKPGGGGGHGMNIARVEIVVSSNQDPSQIAKLVEARLSQLARHPRASRLVPNYSASR